MKRWGQRKAEVTEKVRAVTLPNLEALAHSHCESEVQAIRAISVGLQIVELKWWKSFFFFQINSVFSHWNIEDIWLEKGFDYCRDGKR